MAEEKKYLLKEMDIHEGGRLQAYQCLRAGRTDFTSGPMDVLLFCMKKGGTCLQSSFIPHPIELNSGEAMFLANPRGSWDAHIIGEEGCEFFVIRMDISTLHHLMNPTFDETRIETEPRINLRDLMRLIPVSPALFMCFDQLLHHKLNPPFQALFEKAKFLEIFSLLMESAFGQPDAVCPVLLSPSIEQKLQQVRRHIIENVDEVPDVDQLALKFDLPRNTLREGYRFMYGKTLHQFHADHTLESAMQMLASGEMLVKEIAFAIGYQNPSHFISAFKKKYGFTPKQYLKREP